MFYQKIKKIILGLSGVVVFVLMLTPMGVFAFETGVMSLSQKLTARLEGMAEQAETETRSKANVSTSLRYEVQKDETMLRIAEKMRPAHITVSQMMLALQRENPNAFYGDNVSFLNEGAVLIISDTSTLGLVSAKDAKDEIERQRDAWLNFREDNKHLKSVVLTDQLLTLKEKMAESQRLVKQKEALIDEMSRRNQALMSNQLTNQRGELAAKDLENQALVKRLAILEEEKKATMDQLDVPGTAEKTHLAIFFSDMKNAIIAGLGALVLVLLLFFWFFRSRKTTSSMQAGSSSMSDEKGKLDLEGQNLAFSANNTNGLADPTAASFSKQITDADLENAMTSFTDDAHNQWSEPASADAESDYRLDDDIDAKLDLAKAYIEMGDDKSGLDLLFDVLKDGSSKQKKEAQDIMELH